VSLANVSRLTEITVAVHRINVLVAYTVEISSAKVARAVVVTVYVVANEGCKTNVTLSVTRSILMTGANVSRSTDITEAVLVSISMSVAYVRSGTVITVTVLISIGVAGTYVDNTAGVTVHISVSVGVYGTFGSATRSERAGCKRKEKQKHES
jgi:hypothetical protein